MGTCLGHCFNSNSRKYEKRYSLYFCKRDYVKFGLVKENEKEPKKEVSFELVENPWSLQICNDYVAQTCLPFRHHLETSGMHGDLDFLALDAKALLVPQVPGVCFAQENKSLNSTPPSSLDLEWEHEASFKPQNPKGEEEDSDSTAASLSNNVRPRPYSKCYQTHRFRNGSRRGSATIDSSTGSKDGSRMTTPESLEWDFVDNSIPSIDQETEQLLAEIERLAENALSETGNYIISENENNIPEDSTT